MNVYEASAVDRKTFLELARAKVNLTLHVGGAITSPSDPFYNYHPIDSLVVFSDIGDRLLACMTEDESKHNRLTISGPFGSSLTSNDPSNLILQACKYVSEHVEIPPVEFFLTKNLPVASGIGGGSANAAATLRILQQIVELPAETWDSIALKLGADVPICMQQKTARMTGIGQLITPLPNFAPVYGVLVNPNVSVSTAAVFHHFDALIPAPMPRPQNMTQSLWLTAIKGFNDLETVTCQFVPEVGDALTALKQTSACILARMSGSGATCFGLYRTQEQSLKAAKKMAKAEPAWWVSPVRLGDILTD